MTTQDHAGIGTPETLPTTKLNTFHKNARRGDVDAIAGSLAANGQFRPIVVNKGTHTGRPYEVLAGNHTLKAVRQLAETHPDDPRWHRIDTWIVDVDDDRATKIVLADNRTADLGSYDDESLLDLLETVDHDLDGTGYDYDDLEDLSALLEEVPAAYGAGQEAYRGEDDEEYCEQDTAPVGVGPTQGQGQAAPGYADQPTRMMILHYPIEQFIWVQDQLDQFHQEHPELEGANSRALLYLVGEYTGNTAPQHPSNDDAEQDNQ